MPSRLLNSLLRKSVYFLPIFILGCNTGNSSSSSSVNQGQLQLSGRDSQMALGGTNEYIVSLVGSQNLPAPVSVNVSSSNSNVLSIESNNCSTQVLYSNNSNLNTSCSFYVRGKSIGGATISVVSSNYPIMQESVVVAKQWGTFSSEIQNQYGYVAGISMLSFGGDKVYTYDENGNVLSTVGYGWQLVGGESVTYNGFDRFWRIASDESYVCVVVEKAMTESLIDKIRCSTNNEAWFDLPDFVNQYRVDQISVYKGNIYVLGNTVLPITIYVESCPISNCTNWQQNGESLIPSNTVSNALFESDAYILDGTKLYYQTSSGVWQIYGQYICPNQVSCDVEASESGVAIFPKSIALPPYEQSVYYNGSNNIGDMFESIGGVILVDADTQEGTSMSTTNNNIYITPGDGNVYVSNNANNMWSQWSKVGTNNPLLANVYYHDNKLYSLDLQDNKSQIYIYSLDN